MENMDKEMVETYSYIQNQGFRIKLQCLKCGKLYDMDDYKQAVYHGLGCRGVVSDVSGDSS